MLKNNKVQNWAVGLITQNLSSNLNTTINIGRVDYKLFNNLELQKFYIEDQNQDTLLFVDKMHVELRLFKLLINQIDIEGVELDNLCGNIKIDETGKTNFDFLLNKTDKQKKDSVEINLQLQKLSIQNSNLNLIQINTQNADLTTKTKIFDINLESSVDILTQDTVNASITSLHAKTDTGFELDNLKVKMLGGKHRLFFPEFKLILPASILKLDGLIISNDNPKLENWFENTFIYVPIKNTQIALSDFSAFVPEFLHVQDPIYLNADIAGRLSNLQLSELKVRMGSATILDANININGMTNIDEMFIFGEINRLQTNSQDIQKLISGLNNKAFVLPKEAHRLGKITYKGNITGFLSDLVAYGIFTTNVGSISSDISLKFENNLLDVAYNGKLKTNSFSLGKMLDSPAVGKIAMDINTKGEKRHNKTFKGDIKGKIISLELNNYTYNNADFDGEYDGTGFNGKFNIIDDNIQADFVGIVDFKNSKVPIFDFDLDVPNINFHALNLLKDYPDLTTNFHIQTNISGSTLDNLNGNLVIQDLIIINGYNTLNINDILFQTYTTM